MLEKINAIDNLTISRPNLRTVTQIEALIRAGNENPIVAEIGIGVGATSKEIARVLNNKGEFHIFDLEGRCEELKQDLIGLGFTNVNTHENTAKYWDCYHWSLVKVLTARGKEVFDYIYLDGAHLLLQDLAAFAVCDRLLKVGAIIDFDDYSWRLKDSAWLKRERYQYLPEEQIDAYHIKILVDLFVKDNANYEVLIPDKAFRKIGRSY